MYVDSQPDGATNLSIAPEFLDKYGPKVPAKADSKKATGSTQTSSKPSQAGAIQQAAGDTGAAVGGCPRSEEELKIDFDDPAI